MKKILFLNPACEDVAVCETVLCCAGYDLKSSQSFASALKWLREGGVDLLICTFRPSMEANEFFRSFPDLDKGIGIILILCEEEEAQLPKEILTRLSEVLYLPALSRRVLSAVRQYFSRRETELWMSQQETSSSAQAFGKGTTSPVK